MGNPAHLLNLFSSPGAPPLPGVAGRSRDYSIICGACLADVRLLGDILRSGWEKGGAFRVILLLHFALKNRYHGTLARRYTRFSEAARSMTEYSKSSRASRMDS